MAERYSQSDITTITGKSVFFDANVLLYIFWPLLSEERWIRKYSKILNLLITHGNCLVLNRTILSEVINRVLRIEYEIYKNNTGISLKFKDFRDCPDGQSVLTDIYNIVVNTIFPKFGICDKLFNKDELKGQLQVDLLDFNDKLIVAVCKENQFVLLTNDADLKSADVDILTANNKILGVP